MIKNRLHIVLATTLLITIGSFCFFTFYTKAVGESTNISISPLTFDLSANPGDTVTNELLIRNSGSGEVVVGAEAEDFVATGEEGEVNLTTEKNTYSLASWIEVDGGKFVLNGGQQKRVKFVIRVPYNAEPGGHYASVFAHLSPTLEAATSGSGVGQKIGSLVLLRVGGSAKEDARVASFDTTKGTFEKGPVDFNIRVENTGSVHIKPKGIIAITDVFGKKVADVTVEQKNVLPRAIRHMTAKWDNPPVFGKYTASLLTYYGADNKQITSATTFWIIPWVTIAIWGGVLLVIVGILWIGRRRINNALKALFDKK
jgi:hypothetical protein